MRSLTPKEIGARIRQARADNQMTQVELAQRIGASRFWVAEIERGKPGAELGLVLKALKALRLVVTIETEQNALRREEQQRNTGVMRTSGYPDVDLSHVLSRATNISSDSWKPRITESAKPWPAARNAQIVQSDALETKRNPPTRKRGR